MRLETCILILGFTVSAFFPTGCSPKRRLPDFDSCRAFAVLTAQCDFGPRPVGTLAHDQTRDYLTRELRKYASSVELQTFRHTLGGRTCKLSNIITRFGSSAEPAVLICAHWDTRPTADEELEPANRRKPIVGANDGASGVAVLLELACMFHSSPPATPVLMVLFDGEDYGPGPENMFLGSRYFAANLPHQPIRYGILLDMVGDKDLRIYREKYSQAKAGAVNDKIWESAASLGYQSVFPNETKYAIQDDHLPLIRAGIPCANVIDFDYAFWHTLQDTPDKCSPESLRIVGETIAHVIYSEPPSRQAP